ncbi:prepilin peptidase [Aeromicrobium sp. CTD01-1L150]|uniref:prepilin peptidase n=1 Tax=Aeromicrobium sp. CTD01-1L150 TaxID=3341830 RepID=UPI0035C079F6
MEIVIAAVLAAGIGALGPSVVRRLPEPVPHPAGEPPADEAGAEADGDDASGEQPAEPKIPYAELGSTPRTQILLALLAGGMSATAAAVLPVASMLPVWIVFCGVGSWLAWVDWRTRLLPYRLTAPLHVLTLVLVAVVALATGDWWLLWGGLIANAVVFAGFWLIWFIGTRVGSTFGYGDVRLSAIIGLALGPLGSTPTLAGVYAGFLLGAVGGIVFSWLGVVDRKGFAFGPYMVVGAVAGLAAAPLL